MDWVIVGEGNIWRSHRVTEKCKARDSGQLQLWNFGGTGKKAANIRRSWELGRIPGKSGCEKTPPPPTQRPQKEGRILPA